MILVSLSTPKIQCPSIQHVGDFGHKFCLCASEDLVTFDGIVALNTYKCLGNTLISKDAGNDFKNRFDTIDHSTFPFIVVDSGPIKL